MAPQTVFLIDGTAFCYRAFYAVRNLSTSDGRPTNAVYGFAIMLHALREKRRPDYLGVAFDVGKPTFRHRQFEDYKVQRKPMPDALIGQLPLVKQLLAAYRIPVFEQEGYEAEDVLATIAKRIRAPGLEVFLVTGDKDVLQLVDEQIKVYNPHKDDAVIDAGAVRARYGVGPERMVDLMALMGDDIDNIPGVPGIGEKTATQLLQRFGSLERLYERLDEIESAPRRQSLQAYRAQVELSRSLARIESDVPLEVSLTELRAQTPDWRALRQVFRTLEFKRLLQSVEREAPTTTSSLQNIEQVRTDQEMLRLLSHIRALPRSSVTALVGWPVSTPGADDALVVALATAVSGAWVIRLDAGWGRGHSEREFGAWLADETAGKVSHDAKALMRRLGRLGLALEGVVGDTMVAAHLLNPARTTQTLEDLSDEYLEQPLPPILRVAEAMEGDGEQLSRLGRAALVVGQLHAVFTRKLDAQGLTGLYTQLELPLTRVLAEMERVGVAIDVSYLAGLRASMDGKLAQLVERIHELAGSSFNVNSPKQLARVLFEELKLPVIKRTKTGPSTDSDVLRQLAPRHPLGQALIEYRELAKLVSTYVEALPRLVDRRTGRIHTSFNQTATATGRLSSSEPNLQNIPIRTELGRSIRKAFIAGRPNGVLMAADYSQIELRILAHLAQDPQLIEAFQRGRDIHRFTASLIYGVPEAEVQPEQRNAMKAINYGILYGMTPHGLSKELGITFEEAEAFIAAYFVRYPNVRAYLDGQIEHARRDGFVQTLLGRRRYIPEVNSADGSVRQFGERMAVNAPIQGSAADLIKQAMVELATELTRQRFSSAMVLQVHDELVFESPGEELDRLVALVRRVMEGTITLRVPLTVTVKVGPNWLELSPIP